MKYLAFIPLVFVASCASHPRPQVTFSALPSPAVERVESARYGDVIRAYHVGRYVDPNHPETMQEQHPVYRIEASARWNLHPGLPNTGNTLNPPPDAAFSQPPTSDALQAEMNRQREATERVMQEAARLEQFYAEFQKVVSEMKNVARNNVLMNARLAKTEQRVAEFEKEIQKPGTSPSLTTNEIPALIPEPTDAPKP